MRIIKFKYRHTKRAHWEGERMDQKKRSRKERDGKIKGQMRSNRKGKISTKERKKSAGEMQTFCAC